MASSVPRSELEATLRAVLDLAAQDGHPNQIPFQWLVSCGFSLESAMLCQELLLSEELPDDPAAVTARLLPLVLEDVAPSPGDLAPGPDVRPPG